MQRRASDGRERRCVVDPDFGVVDVEIRASARRALGIAQDIGDRQGIVFGLALLAWHAAQTCCGERAGVLWGAIEAEEMRAGHVGQWEHERAQFRERARADLGSEFAHGRIKGRALSLDEAVEYGLLDD